MYRTPSTMSTQEHSDAMEGSAPDSLVLTEFPRLPEEIRRLIWREASPAPKQLDFRHQIMECSSTWTYFCAYEKSQRTADEPPIALAVNHESRTEAEIVFDKIRLVNVVRIPNDRYESLGSAAYGDGDEFQGIDAGYHFFNAGNDMVILPLDLIYRPFRYGNAE